MATNQTTQARLGVAGTGKARSGEDLHRIAGWARLGAAWRGAAWHGKNRMTAPGYKFGHTLH